jgi:outer membrane protein assembly factor BamA
VRSIAVLTVCVAALAALFVYQLPENEADAETRHAARRQEVQSVALDGYGLPISELRAVLATRAGDLLDATKLRADRDELRATLVRRGYLSAKVQDAQVMFDADGGAFVTFAIEQGPLFHVRSVEVVGTTERDAGVVTIASGEVVRSERLEHAREAMTERLVSRGKLAGTRAGRIDVKLAPDEAAAAVDVVLAAKP